MRSAAVYASERYAWMEYFMLINGLAASVDRVTRMAAERGHVEASPNGQHATLALKSDQNGAKKGKQMNM